MSAKKEYVKLWLSYETYFQSYTPEEIGNLVLAMLHYKDTGEEPAFQGNERFNWPALQRDIDEPSPPRMPPQSTPARTAKKAAVPGKSPQNPKPKKTSPVFPKPRKP